jgi:hypothetical protein
MGIRLFGAGSGECRRLLLAVAGAVFATLLPAFAEEKLISAPEPAHPTRPRVLSGRLPDKPSLPPVFKISVGPLGFAAPGAFYMGQRTSLVSLDFVDEDRLLFTFRVPGLIHRETSERDTAGEQERRIRALVLKLPDGRVESETVWTVHDRARYVWMLRDGSFLFRDLKNLETGDASLELKPYLRFPGALLWLEIDPAQQFLVTNSLEPAAAQMPEDRSTDPNGVDVSLQPGGRGSESTGLGSTIPTEKSAPVEAQKRAKPPDLAVRILRKDSGQVILVSRSRAAVHLPVNSDGYLESLRTRGGGWLLNLNYFSGGSTILGEIDSACSPLFDFLSQREVLVTGCTSSGAGDLAAMTTEGRHIWEVQSAETTVWPLLVRAPDGSRVARETLVVSTPVTARAPIDPDDIKGQLVEVLDAANGNTALETTANPVLDAGGNVAISPSGRRVAVLNGDKIEIFELPAAPPLPEPAAHSTKH